MLPDIAHAMVRMSLAASAGVMVVWLLRPLLRRRLGPSVAYGLWILVPVAALTGLLPAGPAVGPAWRVDPWPWVAALWIGGAAVSLGLLAARQRAFEKALGKPRLDAGGLPILHAPDAAHAGPAVVGGWNPRIVLPEGFEGRYSAEERKLILAHERAHLFAWDAQANAVATLLVCLNWFNPLAYAARWSMRVDQELARDADVVAQFPGARRAYAETLLKTQTAGAAPPFGCQWPARGEASLKERIETLKLDPATPAQRRAGAMAVLAMGLALSLAGWAAAPAYALLPSADRGPMLQIRMVLKDVRVEPIRYPTLEMRPGETFIRPIVTPAGGRYDLVVRPELAADRVRLTLEARRSGRVMARLVESLEEGEIAVLRLDGSAVVASVVRSRP